MPTRIVILVFLFVTLLGGCAQNSPKESSLSSALKTEPVEIYASIQGQSKEAIIDQMMAESGMDDGIVQLPGMVAMGFDQQPAPPIGRMEYDAFRKNLIEAFDSQKVRKIVVAHLDAHYEAERFAKLLAMLKTPLAQKMAALEMAAHTPQAQQEMMRMGNVIMGQATPARLDLARRIDEVVQATEIGVDMQMMMAKVSMTNLNTIVPVAQRMSDAQLGQMLEQMRMQFLYPARQFTQLGLVYTYRSVSDDELEAYLQLHDTAIGRWSTLLMRDAWMSVSEHVAADLAEKMNNSFVEKNAF